MNNLTLMGRLTADPELRTTTNGNSVATFTVAVDRGYGDKKETDFVPCVAWRKTGEFVHNYFVKGDTIAVVGSLTSRRYEDKNGAKRTAWECLVEKAYFCGAKARGTTDIAAAATAGEYNKDAPEIDDDDLPF